MEYFFGALASQMLVVTDTEQLSAGEAVRVQFCPRLLEFGVKMNAAEVQTQVTLSPLAGKYEITLSEASLNERLKPFIVGGAILACSCLVFLFMNRIFKQGGGNERRRRQLPHQ